MKTYQILALTTVCCILAVIRGHAEITPGNQKNVDALVEMTNILRTEGIENFLAVGRQRGWVAPKFFSAWYIARLPDDPEGLKKIEEAKSELGLEIAKQLSFVAQTVRETKNAILLEKSSSVLFRAGEWIGTQLGYGNLILLNRVYDIASIAAIKLMADLSCPTDKAEAVMKRCDWQWANAENRRQVLFEETGGSYFASVPGADVAKTLLDEWRNGVMSALDPVKVKVQPDLAIFIRDDFAKSEIVGLPETTWHRKTHFLIGENTFGSVNPHRFESLREFRKRYGAFPTKPTNYVKGVGESDIKAAFWELSWKDPLPVAGAAGTYEDYLNNRLSDMGFQATPSYR